MAVPTGPLLSFGASGSIAKTVVFSKWKGRPYVRRHVIPANPQTAAQTLTRNIFTFSSNVWKASPTILRSPWDRFATGQVLTGRNAFIGKNVQLMRSETDVLLWLGSPGAKGGLAFTSIALTPTSQGFDVTNSVPATPTGWTFTAGQAAALESQDPQSGTDFLIGAAEDLVEGDPVQLTGLKALTEYTVAAWIKWAKPDGSIAYGVSINDTDTTLA